ncbi:MAG: type II toxin-antitoxin system VapC family toxin [Tagaea sp.]|nr:type II toxin-antitoxin system VapC family toxin [Tagaea sp.]
MILLLDTHVFIWARTEPERLKASTHAAIAEATTVFVSVASAWEVEIKTAKGLLKLPATVAEGIAQSGFQPLPITLDHVERLRDLPLHHKDPFDRMLVAQALAERATLVTVDRHFARYGIKLMAA